jgi:hypothetical protein
MRQEQMPASTDIAEIVPGIYRTQLPIDLPGLGHVNMYVLEDERGVAVVDPGMPGRESFHALESRLKDMGIPLRRPLRRRWSFTKRFWCRNYCAPSFPVVVGSQRTTRC